MSLLQPVVDKLFAQKNIVVMPPSGSRRDGGPLTVQVVALFTFNDVPKQLLFCKEHYLPMVLTGDVTQNPAANRTALVEVVTEFDDNGYHFRYLQGRHEGTTVDELFAMLLSGNYDHNYVKLLEFLPTKEIFPCFHSNALATFDGVDKFIDTEGLFHTPKAMINLEFFGEGQYHRGRDNERTDLEFGNILMWCDNGNIWFVTKRHGDSLPLGLKVVTSAKGYNEFIRFTREYSIKGWRVRGVNPMPYNLPKDEARSGIHRGGVHNSPTFSEKQVCEMLTTLLPLEPGSLGHATTVSLGAVYQRHFQSDSKVTLEKYMAAAEEAINEAFICIDGVGVKKRAEIKAGLLQHFRKRFELNADK